MFGIDKIIQKIYPIARTLGLPLFVALPLLKMITSIVSVGGTVVAIAYKALESLGYSAIMSKIAGQLKKINLRKKGMGRICRK